MTARALSVILSVVVLRGSSKLGNKALPCTNMKSLTTARVLERVLVVGEAVSFNSGSSLTHTVSESIAGQVSTACATASELLRIFSGHAIRRPP